MQACITLDLLKALQVSAEPIITGSSGRYSRTAVCRAGTWTSKNSESSPPSSRQISQYQSTARDRVVGLKTKILVPVLRFLNHSTCFDDLSLSLASLDREVLDRSMRSISAASFCTDVVSVKDRSVLLNIERVVRVGESGMTKHSRFVPLICSLKGVSLQRE
jgi:hypothetical protein